MINREERLRKKRDYASKIYNQDKKLASLKQSCQVRKTTVEWFNKKLIEQNFACEICKKEESCNGNHGKIKRLAIDHCHKSGKNRGLLCQNCNNGLGAAKDNCFILKEIIRYLKKHLN